MYVTGPHTCVATQDGVVELVRAERRVFAGPSDFLANATHRAQIGRYLSDLVRPHGLALHASVFDGVEISRELGHSYGEMAETLIGTVVHANEPVDLLVLAFAIHDVRPGRATATYLSHICPGNPLAFAVCDQGSAAAFTGLRLIREYLLSGVCRRALLLVVEQGALPYDGAPPAVVPSRHAGVALLYACGSAAPGPAQRLRELRQHTHVAPDAIDVLVEAELAELARGYDDVTVVLGGPGATGLSPRLVPPLPALSREPSPVPGVTRVLAAPPGQPFTGVWWELAGACAEPGEPRRTVLADYDPGLGYLCLAAVDHG